MSRVFIGVGHGGSDSGAVGYIVEKDGALVIATACKDYLIANGVEVRMSRYIDEDESLREKINECNAYNPDLCADIHLNAGGGDGAEVFHSVIGGKGKILAENILKELEAIGQNSRGTKTKVDTDGTDYFGFIRCTNAPAVITEAYFVDNATDVQIGDTVEEQKIVGQAIAKGFLRTLGISSNNDVPVNQSPAENGQNTAESPVESGYSYKEFVGDVQKATGAKVDKIAGPETLSKTVTVSKTKNNRHTVVKPIQKYLYLLGYTEVGEADGIAGIKFDTAVKHFQRDNGCVVDGEITARNKTWKKLLKLA